MSKQFRNCDLNQVLLLPPSLQDWLPESHLGRFVADLVETLDLSGIYAKYEEGDGRGMAAYDPRMMVRLLIYGYCRGVASSRRIERATHEDVAFRYLAADQHPDHDTIADFRKQHLAQLAQLFVQVLKLCQQAGLVKLGHVALDGTKVKANASKHKAMSYERMGKAEKELEEEVQALMAEAGRIDAEEDGKYGKGKRGDEGVCARLQRAGGSGPPCPGHRGGVGDAGSQRQEAVGADAGGSGSDDREQAAASHGG